MESQPRSNIQLAHYRTVFLIDSQCGLDYKKPYKNSKRHELEQSQPYQRCRNRQLLLVACNPIGGRGLSEECN
jgi:hypothetical protein